MPRCHGDLTYKQTTQQSKPDSFDVKKRPLALKFQVYFQQEEVKPTRKEGKMSFKVTWRKGPTEQCMSAAHGVRRNYDLTAPFKIKEQNPNTLVCTKLVAQQQRPEGRWFKGS